MMKIDLEASELADFIGSAQGLFDTVETPIYLDDLLRIGHHRALKQFDQDAAAYGSASQRINHMFEWGTAGINPAPNTPRLNPTSRNARLWKHKLSGGQKAIKSIEFEFKASKVPVPLPTPRTAGISKSYMSGNSMPKRRHFFYWKAMVMEMGIPVTIKPVNAGALFIPLRGNPQTSDKRAIKRNYIMTQSTVTMVPGEQVMGEFSKYWVGWWSTVGYEIVQTIAQGSVDLDSEKIISKTGRARGARRYAKGTTAKTFQLQVRSAKEKAKTQLMRNSEKRNLESRKID